jgi:hypothetical protein
VDAAQAMHAHAASEQQVHDLWVFGDYLTPLYLLLMGALVTSASAVARRSGGLPDALAWSGIAIGLPLAAVGLITIPFTATLLDDLNTLLLQLAAGWILATSIVLMSRARAGRVR